jgi:hypothetical protein
MTAVHEARTGRSIARKTSAYVAKKYRYLATDPGFFWMSTVARFEFARDWATRPKYESSGIASSSPLIRAAQDAATVVKTLQTEGYYVGFTLAPDAVSELMACARGTVCYGDRNRNLPFQIDDRAVFEQKLGRKLKLANHFDQQLEWPVFSRLTRDPWLNAVARGYLCREPLFLRSEVLWSFATPATFEERRNAAQVLHCDINDFKTLKVYFYLTDVGPNNGPHEYVKKGPVKRKLMHQMLGQRCASIPDDTLLRIYGANQLVTVCGPAGTGFAGDPYYFHRGAHSSEGCRVLLQFEFGCRAYRTWYFDV